jgi:hypothetical protein
MLDPVIILCGLLPVKCEMAVPGSVIFTVLELKKARTAPY